MGDLSCEQCATGHGILDSHSMLVVLQKVDTGGYTFFQCENGQEWAYMNYQHFCCSQECMGQAVRACLNEHHQEQHLHPIPPGEGSTILHRIVLGRGLACAVCHAALEAVAYRFVLTRATPYNELPHSHHGLEGWCCSLEHARSAAHAVLDGYL